MNLTPDLSKIKDEIEKYALECGLDFFPVIFEVLDWNQLNEVASYGGFPNRYPHWRHGMEYEDLSKRYAWGLSKIYEMVINNDPCYAYLLYANSIVDQKLVMAHVYAHCDFFKNNVYFAHTNRKMMDEMGNHRTRIMRYINRYGQDVVEDFIDACLSIDTLIDCHGVAIKRAREKVPMPIVDGEESVKTVRKLKSGRQYMDKFINPPDFMKAQAQQLVDDEKLEHKFPESPERDVMGFLMDFAPLEKWQRDILSLLREEAYYFLPQGQTKIMNEGWACVAGDTLVLTGKGLIPAKEIVEQRLKINVSDGEIPRRLYDFACFPGRESVKIETKRGLVLEGSTTHQILLKDSNWRRLDGIKVGDKISVPSSAGLWPESYQNIEWSPLQRQTLTDVAGSAGVSLSTVIRHKFGRSHSCSASLMDPALAVYESQIAKMGLIKKERNRIKIPAVVDERLASFIGYLVGDGHISRVKRVLGLTSGDELQADHFAELGRDLFGVEFRKKKDDNRWRILASSEDLADFLEHLGLKTGVSARIKDVPQVILRSPKKVMRAFLRAYYDCDGYAGRGGVILSTSSNTMSRQIQLILLNFGIMTWRRKQPKDIWHVRMFGLQTKRFMEEIGFGLLRKQRKLEEYVNNRKWFKEESVDDEVFSIEATRSDVYDFSVSDTHRYVAGGLINHNSYWHSHIMTRRALKDSEVIDYADHHSGTVAPYPGRLNPYKMGIELFKNIEERWNKGRFGKEYDDCENMIQKAKWDKGLGLGLKKIFEVRKIYSDITFIDEFLTPEFCRDQKLFTFAYNPSADQYEIASREFKKVKEKLLFQLTNFGHPIISVVNGNYKNRGELMLKHQHDGVDLRPDYASETLKSLYKIWARPVNIETMVEGVPKILCFDGEEYKEFRP
ncbi:MAG: SpoVR family protein [Deltaproteobacteria bacterium CG11_big_fil_rev_8_21_14_0_20_49_13]|nr:MAG: SpoVR family protein [Deltaproteobacteria bacterium CG11_big_fil_rev_8_21_14_0_20_49_13]